MRARLDPALLRTETTWVRALAARLCQEPNGADDVSQEALCLALESAPVPEPMSSRLPTLRAWLRTTVRTLARQRTRDARRRTRHEEQHATLAEREVPATLDVVERTEQLERLVRAVLALDEPYRRTLLARYFDGEDSAAIAQREGIDPATVRKRVERALATLRGQLVDASDDPRRARLGLAALAAGLPAPRATPTALAPAAAAPPTLLGILLMKRLVTAALVLVGLALGTVALWPEPGERAPSEGEPAPSARTAIAATSEVAENVPDRQLLAGSSPSGAPGPVASTATPDPRYGSLRIEAVWEHDRTPAVGRKVDVVAHHAREPHPGIRTDGEGRAVYDRLAPGRYLVRHDVFAMRTVIVRAAEETHLTLPVSTPPGIRGRVLDLDGRPVAAVEVSWQDDGYVTGGTTRTDASGRFAFDDVASNVYLRAGLGDRWFGGESEYESLLLPGEVREVDLVEQPAVPKPEPPAYDGPTGTLEIHAVDGVGAPSAGLKLLVEGPERQPFSRQVRTDAEGMCRIEDLPVALAKVTPIRGLQRGASFEIQLLEDRAVPLHLTTPPSLAIRGMLLDPDGRQVSGATILLLHTEHAEDLDNHIAQTWSLADGSFALEDLWPGTMTLYASHPSFAPGEVQVQLEGSDIADLSIRLSAAPTIHGLLVDPRGNPLAGWIVSAHGDAHETWTAADGTFDLALQKPVPHRLLARDPSDPTAFLIDRPIADRVGPDTERHRYVVTDDTRATAWIVGTLTDANTGRPPSSYHVMAWDSDAGTGSDIHPVDPRTGRFRIGPLPPGQWTLSLNDGRRRDPSLEPGPFTLAAHQELEIPAQTIPARGTLRVVVELPEGRNATASGIQVWLHDEHGVHIGNTRAVADDPATFEPYTALPAGTVRVHCFGEGLHVIDQPVTIAAGQENRLVLRPRSGLRTWIRIALPEPVARMFSLDYRVVTADGAAVLDGQHYVMADGRDVLDLAPGRYRITIEHASGARGEFDLEAGAGTPEQPIELRLQ